MGERDGGKVGGGREREEREVGTEEREEEERLDGSCSLLEH